MDIYEEVVSLRRQGRRAALATIIGVRGSIPSFQSAKMLVRDDGSILGTIGGGCVEAEVWQVAREVMEQERPRTLSFDLNQDPKFDTGLVCGGTVEIYVEPVLPVPHLYIFGAGHVSLSLYKAARLAGFDVSVIDDRESYANRERFPEAREIHANEYEKVCEQLSPTESEYIVIATRGHRDDMRVLRWAIEAPVRYLGMIGSQRKWLKIAQAFAEEGVADEKLERVLSPVGLDIGAQTPEEIAISIVAEMIAARHRMESGVQRKRVERKVVRS
ncbi:MAG TPA: XdhC/CoxI family protein [Terriglobales bacterium]|nr:XdhC/CoxI family protein [Terriglobales bacterium]